MSAVPPGAVVVTADQIAQAHTLVAARQNAQDLLDGLATATNLSIDVVLNITSDAFNRRLEFVTAAPPQELLNQLNGQVAAINAQLTALGFTVP